ncbi:MAG TPA: glucose-6-phosphate dehydrogenase [Candidatus Dormibacteraeota bacterium]|nr:glucose-6-phosphate dehydrogenase [Candidatus Dormibacteraeota bacterium]
MKPPAAVRKPRLEPAIIVIFGITGDLSQRYLLPSLYHLMKDGLLHEQTEIIGVTRSNMTAGELFEKVELCVNEVDKICDPTALKAMHDHTSMFRMDLDDPANYDALLNELNAIEEQKGLCMNRLYYLSIPPQAYTPVVHLLGERGLNASCQHGSAKTRLLVEKPFGFDLESAKKLIDETGKAFDEEQIFRIDHYMAKETVQNILAFRFQNPIFEALWSREHIASIEINAQEKIGIEGRAAFYEPLGALRDFIQSHLLQILGIVAMDRPTMLDSDHIHASKQALLERVKPVPADEVAKRAIRGQYNGYREEVKNPGSVTETYAAITVFIDNPRWHDVPVTLRTGKGLDERKTEICVTFHSTPEAASNQLRFRIQPNEGIELDLVTKKPGYSRELQKTVMDFSYQQNFIDHGHPDAYERVLVDAVRGDHTLFATSEEVLASWRIVQPVLDAWAQRDDDLAFYKLGSRGPVSNDAG